METPTTPRSTLNPPVFYTSAALILALVLFTVLLQEEAQSLFNHVQQWIITNASWFYVLAVALILISVVFLAVSRYGDIKLGPDHSRPDYRNTTWFAMLFSAGMGIGLMFFGVAEPVMHFTTPPVGEPNTVQAAKEAMKLTFFHWGLHAWAIYAIVALILAFFSYRHGLPLTLRSALYPLIGERIYGPIGHAVDIFAIIGTVFGVATSLGYGVLQINSGLHHLFGWPVNQTVQIALIAATCGLATLSVASGLDRGIRILSELNLSLAVILLLFVLVLGPTVFLLQTYVQNTGAYLSDIVNKTFNLYAYEPTDWIGGWTLLYWGWWLSWSPFVGLFIARISRGRTIREFVCGVLFDGTQNVAMGAIRGLKDARTTFLVGLACYWLVGVPLACLLAFAAGWGAAGVWWGLAGGLACAAIGLTLAFEWKTARLLPKATASETSALNCRAAGRGAPSARRCPGNAPVPPAAAAD
ncbi:BCCT family transporter [Pseudomonas aeruginosa]|uniref:BCCT family transporter n=1 Tax=Pseudomonas aeruginosa TaxID=287 RepID=UPI0022EB8EDA|nr:BCCT family transporter [Pseudomonas aeruginosa]